MTATDWIQAVCAIATALLAVITFLQGIRIKTLTDIVSSLEKQASISEELLGFEIRSRIKDVQPIFSPYKIVPDGQSFTLRVRNRGQKARNVTLTPKENINNVVRVAPTIPSVIQNDFLDLKYQVINLGAPYKIELSYEDDYGQQYRQNIVSQTKGYHLTLPETIAVVEE